MEGLSYQQQEQPQEIRYELRDCPDCGKPTTSFGWCESNATRENFLHWTSGNKDMDELIHHIQLNATQICDYLEWIPFEKFEMIKHVARGGFSNVYSAFWMEGPRLAWDNTAQEWTRTGPIKVALKRLDDSRNISSSYIDQIKQHHKCLQSASLAETFGITKDSTSNYMIVMKYYENGNLYQYLDRSNGILSWTSMIDTLRGIAEGLEKIHSEGKVHKNLHGGNLLVDEKFFMGTRIVDVGFYGPCHYKSSNQIYGVLPYTAPEVLRGEDYITASDIYSFGIIMNTFATGKRAWYNRAHDINLAKDICNGERLEIPDDTPTFYAELMKKCWDNDPEKRPTASYLNDKLGEWITLICDDPKPSEISNEYAVFEEKRYKMIKMITEYAHPNIHPEASYTSKLLEFPELSNKMTDNNYNDCSMYEG